MSWRRAVQTRGMAFVNLTRRHIRLYTTKRTEPPVCDLPPGPAYAVVVEPPRASDDDNSEMPDGLPITRYIPPEACTVRIVGDAACLANATCVIVTMPVALAMCAMQRRDAHALRRLGLPPGCTVAGPNTSPANQIVNDENVVVGCVGIVDYNERA